MNAVQNINLSWNEVKEKCSKGVWKNIWPDLRKGGGTGYSVDMNEIVELAKQTSLDEVNVEDVEEIVQETTASLSNNELKELADQEEHKNIEGSDNEEELSTAFLKFSLTTTT
ncbi:tigger transposable element-derived protein 1-like [Trichonephila clavata]|uniref:Tigger transposable element-derived protein 1-like n=1 Tax=Trichonephila clavata TaxID=2740835 RepID=A0A8X6LX82_TRICU|nr:tigger transposable element-derived protein 1-like [Trichonephila clavata]